MEKALRLVKGNQRKNEKKVKKAWYKIGRRLHKGGCIEELNKEQRRGAIRTYKYYKKKSHWEGPSVRMLT